MVRMRLSSIFLALLAGFAPGTGAPASAPSAPAPAAVYGQFGPELRLVTGSPGVGLIEALHFATGPAGQATIREFGRDLYGVPLYLDASEASAGLLDRKA